MQAPERVNILGVGISAINMTMALNVIEEWIAKREKQRLLAERALTALEPWAARLAPEAA